MGRVVGAAFSCTPVGKATQGALGTAKMGMTAVSTTSKVAQVGKAAASTNKISKIGANTLKTVRVGSQKGPEILEGNKKWGLVHSVLRHGAETTEKNVSKFLPGIGKKEISNMVMTACEKCNGWQIAKNGRYNTIFDVGRTIGTERDTGNLTSKLRVVLDGNLFITAYPY